MEKRQRTSAKAKFTRLLNQLLSVIDSGVEAGSAEIIYADLIASWSYLEMKHNDYIITIEDGDAAITEDQWICDMEKNYFDIRVKYSSFVTDLKQ